jgi:hypothetical protein
VLHRGDTELDEAADLVPGVAWQETPYIV